MYLCFNLFAHQLQSGCVASPIEERQLPSLGISTRELLPREYHVCLTLASSLTHLEMHGYFFMHTASSDMTAINLPSLHTLACYNIRGHFSRVLTFGTARDNIHTRISRCAGLFDFLEQL